MINLIDPRLIDLANRMEVRLDLEPTFNLDGALGSYSATKDIVYLYPKHLKAESELVNLVLLHELVHASGHKHRLNRLHNMDFSPWSEEYLTQYVTHTILDELGLNTKVTTNKTIDYLRKMGPNSNKDLLRTYTGTTLNYFHNLVMELSERKAA